MPHLSCLVPGILMLLSVFFEVYSFSFQAVHLGTVNKCYQCLTLRSLQRISSFCQHASNNNASSADAVSDDSDLFNKITNNDRNHFINDADSQGQSQILSELQWRSKKISLEEAESERFKKRIRSKPWKLPIEESRKWVYANFGVGTKEEFMDLVANGNLRTPYVPKNPEKYYSEKGTWISWRHFLCLEEDC